MPPKPPKSKAVLKAEINEKVREIRLKQQKWMEQRESTMKMASRNGKTSDESSKNSSRSALHSSNHDSKVSARSAMNGKGVNGMMNTPTPNSNGFHSWRSNRQKSVETPADNLLDNVELRYSDISTTDSVQQGTESDTVQQGPESKKVQHVTGSDGVHHGVESDFRPHGVVSPLQLPQSDRSGYDYLKVEHSNRSTTPAEYDSLADEIVHRVKRELQLQAQLPGKHIEECHRDGSPTTVVSGRTRGDDKRQNISSHQCPQCHKLMATTTQHPMLFIPCGHTSCQSCVASSPATCSTCGTAIQSATPNIMLYQIIADYHSEKSVVCTERAEKNDNMLGKTYSQIPTKPSKKTAAEYEEDYRNLLLRCDVLREEEAAILEKISATDRERAEEQLQIDNIGLAQQQVRDEIRRLEEKIEELETHKHSYRDKIADLESRKNKERRRLEMVRMTVSQLKGEINKIKLELNKDK